MIRKRMEAEFAEYSARPEPEILINRATAQNDFLWSSIGGMIQGLIDKNEELEKRVTEMEQEIVDLRDDRI